MTYKTIFSGRLEFGSERSYEQVLKQFEHRTVNYYRNDILLNEEEIFEESSFSLTVPRVVIPDATEKSWKNTVNLLKYLNEYAVAGNFRVWIIGEGKLRHEYFIEPDSDKSAVRSFLKGRELIKVEGMENEAMKALNRAISKFERHASAYERRGYINFRLRNFEDALYDFTKSISINPNNAEPYWGRANVRLKNGELKEAIQDLALTAKKSIPHQPIYWSARRLKGECHMNLGEYDKAIFEYKMVTKRIFKEDDPNYKWRRHAFFNYGRSLLEVGEFAKAIEAFNAAMEIEEDKNSTPHGEQLLYLGIAKQKAGKSGFKKDLKAAAKLGNEKAAELLQACA